MPDGKSEIPADILETTNKLVNHYVNPYEPRTDCRPDFRPNLRKLIAEALAAERQRDRWQPIETAPISNGSHRFLAHIIGHGPCVCYAGAGRYIYSAQTGKRIHRATHWMPLPPKPHHFNQEGK